MDKNTAKGRALRTAYQGIMALVINLPALLLIPEVRALLDTLPVAVLAYLLAFSGVVSYFQNKIEG